VPVCRPSSICDFCSGPLDDQGNPAALRCTDDGQVTETVSCQQLPSCTRHETMLGKKGRNTKQHGRMRPTLTHSAAYLLGIFTCFQHPNLASADGIVDRQRSTAAARRLSEANPASGFNSLSWSSLQLVRTGGPCSKSTNLPSLSVGSFVGFVQTDTEYTVTTPYRL
jgi:hypothetical protein